MLEHFAAHGGTVLTGPNFSYDYLLDHVPAQRLATLDLSSWRLAFNGAEPVSAATVRRFTEALAPSGVGPSVMYLVYGMAEATLAIAFPRPGDTARIRAVDRAELAATGVVRTVEETGPRAKPVVSVGRAVHGVDLRIVREDEELAADGELGEIQISGEPVTSGYFNNADATAELFHDRWLRTGDLGFLLDGELYVAGRRKEMVVVHGQNFFPDDVEAVTRSVPGVYRRRCVAFSDTDTEGGELIGVIVETADDPASVCEEVRRTVSAELDLPHVRVYAVKPRWLPRTTSGKWQRVLAARRVTMRRHRVVPQPDFQTKENGREEPNDVTGKRAPARRRSDAQRTGVHAATSTRPGNCTTSRGMRSEPTWCCLNTSCSLKVPSWANPMSSPPPMDYSMSSPWTTTSRSSRASGVTRKSSTISPSRYGCNWRGTASLSARPPRCVRRTRRG